MFEILVLPTLLMSDDWKIQRRRVTLNITLNVKYQLSRAVDHKVNHNQRYWAFVGYTAICLHAVSPVQLLLRSAASQLCLTQCVTTCMCVSATFTTSVCMYNTSETPGMRKHFITAVLFPHTLSFTRA